MVVGNLLPQLVVVPLEVKGIFTKVGDILLQGVVIVIDLDDSYLNLYLLNL